MVSPLKILIALLKFSFAVGVAGGLTDLTIGMASKAADAHKTGLVSLTALNKQLFGSKR